MLRNTLVVLSAMAVCAASASAAIVVLQDDCDFANGAVTAQNPGVYNDKNPGNPVYTGLGEMRFTSGHAIRTVGEWNPEGDEGYVANVPGWTNYPPGDPKAITLSFDLHIDPNLAHAARLAVTTRNSDRGSMEPRGMKAEIRPYRDSAGFYIETTGSGLWNGGDVLGSLQTNGTTTGNAIVTGGFTGNLADNANRYTITITDTVDLYTLLVEGTAGPVNGESLQYSLDLSGRTHKNTDNDPPAPCHNHVWIGNEGGNFNIDNLLVTIPEPASVALIALGLPLAIRRRR